MNRVDCGGKIGRFTTKPTRLASGRISIEISTTTLMVRIVKWVCFKQMNDVILEGGSSDSPCAPTYNGGAPFTEPESRALRDAVLAEAYRTKSYLTVHSYGQVT